MSKRNNQTKPAASTAADLFETATGDEPNDNTSIAEHEDAAGDFKQEPGGCFESGGEDTGEDLDDVCAELGLTEQDDSQDLTGRHSIYELYFLTGIPQRRIRSGDLTNLEIARIQALQS